MFSREGGQKLEKRRRGGGWKWERGSGRGVVFVGDPSWHGTLPLSLFSSDLLLLFFGSWFAEGSPLARLPGGGFSSGGVFVQDWVFSQTDRLYSIS